MSFIDRMLIHTITVWSVTGHDAYGSPTFTKSTMKGRWEDKQQLIKNLSGDQIMSSAVVFLASTVSPNDRIELGSTTVTTPSASAKAVMNYRSTPSIKGNTILYEVYL